MNTHSLNILEFYKIKEKIADLALTELGKDYILNLISLNSIEEVEFHWNLMQDAAHYLISAKPPKITLYNIKPLLQNVHIDSFFLTQKQIYKIKITLDNILKLKNIFSDKKKTLPHLATLSKKIQEIQPLQDELNRSFTTSGDIKDSASPELSEIRTQISRLSSSIHKYLNQIIDSHITYLEEKNYIIIDNRFLLLVKSQFKNKIKGLVHSKSASGHSLYIEPEKIINMNNSLVEYKKDEDIAIYHILLLLTRSISRSQKEIQNNLKIAGLIDASFAKLDFAEQTQSTRPKFNSHKEIYLPQARHPLIKDCVPIDIKIRPPHLTLIISGPNTGGKTISLKTAGLLSLMASAGLFLPTKDNATLPFFDNIFIDLGDEQSIELALSTFSAHIINIKYIIENMTSHSLVLIDEPGTGTEPEFGNVFAESLLETLSHNSILSFITTHYQNIKTLALNNPLYQNASVTFDEETLQPRFSLVYDIPGDSHPYPILKHFNFPDTVLHKIKKKLSNTENQHVSHLIQNLMREKQKLENKNAELQATQNIVKEKLEAQNKKEKILNEQEKKLKHITFKELQKFLKEKRSLFENILKQLIEKGKDKTTIKKAHQLFKNIEEEAKSLLQQTEEDEIENEEFAIGEVVEIKNQHYSGTIRTIKDDKVELETPIGITHITKSQLKKIHKTNTQAVSVAIEKKQSVKSSLDIRGLYKKEALSELEEYFDALLLSKMPFFKIIHGKGSGQLKQMVQNFMQTKLDHNEIKKFYFAPPQDGGDGCTIVEL